jgi:ATP-dependent DNA helicase RecG
MRLDQLLEVINSGEGLSIKFKECQNGINRDVYESTCAFPAKFIIENQQVKTENANPPHGHGMINPADFPPYPKNPVIALFFKEIGRTDELGSGVRNLYKYTRIYSGGGDPQLVEDDIFRIIIPTIPATTEQVAGMDQDRLMELLSFCREARSTKEIMDFLGLKHREHFRSKILKPLIEQNKLFLLFPNKTRSSKQKYYSKD